MSLQLMPVSMVSVIMTTRRPNPSEAYYCKQDAQ
jgi:hypothetical protein